MGNQLVAFAPSLIRPVEFYLTDVPDYTFESNLGSTRFLKVCRAKQDDLLYVIKVFVIHEHSVPIQIYCDRLIQLRNCLSSSPSPNCLPFIQATPTERSVIVVRPYIKYSLYDRISTRPFILWSEKLWIAFQLLCGLVQLHKHGLCHGDLKLENILITPGLRLLLCDFAPFKPVYLPRNNPSAIFGFFFDTAGRRCCYVAPERFHDDKSRVGADNLLTQEDELKHILLPSMDIFSAGCCLIELLTEGRVPFDLSQLLSFCANEYEPSSVIEQIDDVHARELVSHMIQSNPTQRLNAEEYLTKFRGKLFPEVFYSTLQSYYDLLSFLPLTKPDSRMVRLYMDTKNLPDEPAICLIFTSLVTAEIRGLQTTTAKLYALESLRNLSTNLTDETILERVIPYIVYLLLDVNSHRVRAQALTTLVDCLDLVTEVPPSDYNIFSGYIFPALEKLDRDILVRVSLAKNIARIAKISMRYLEASFTNHPNEFTPQQQLQFHSEFQSQSEAIGNFLSSLLTDNDSVVKRVLVSTPGSLATLCTYFGPGKAHDILLSHLITFLNDKDDIHLRLAFFKCVPAVAAFIGWHSAPLLIPLLKQGLSDVEEFVMREALLTVKSLTEINFFGRRFLLDLLDETLPFTIHPNLWLRNAAVGVISCIKNNLSQVDVYCHVIPKLKVYLKTSSHSIWGVNEVSILSKVRQALERQVYESCARAKGTLLTSTIDFLQNNDGKGDQPDSLEVINFLARLRAEGLPQPLDPVYTMFLQRHVFKVNLQRSLRLVPLGITSLNSSTSIVGPLPHGGSSTAGGVRSTTLSSTYSQPSLQSHILTLSTPPLKEINYSNGSGSEVIISTQQPFSSSYAQAIASNYANQYQQQSFSERPRGILVAHLHEHRNSILKLCPLTSFRGLFASCSRENVRIWDAEKMEGRNVANRSRCIIKLQGDSILTNLAYSGPSNIIGITDDKDLYGFALENMTSRSVFTISINNKKQDVGIPVGLESSSPNIFVLGTEFGALIGYDVRLKDKEIFRLQSELKSGLLTALTADEDKNWMCTGTSKGILTCWDLRFSIPVNTIKTDSSVRKMKASPFHSSGVFTSSRNQNEVSLWNLETGSRDLCLWASQSPPLSMANMTSQVGTPTSPTSPSIPSLHSIMGITFVKSLGAIVTGGTDMCLRWWDRNSPSDSTVLSYKEKAELQISGVHRTSEFRFRLVDGIEVIHDVSNAGRTNQPTASFGTTTTSKQRSSDSLSGLPNSSNSGAVVMGNSHHNSITDVTTVSTPNQSFILTSSSDGVIKVWK